MVADSKHSISALPEHVFYKVTIHNALNEEIEVSTEKLENNLLISSFSDTQKIPQNQTLDGNIMFTRQMFSKSIPVELYTVNFQSVVSDKIQLDLKALYFESKLDLLSFQNFSIKVTARDSEIKIVVKYNLEKMIEDAEALIGSSDFDSAAKIFEKLVMVIYSSPNDIDEDLATKTERGAMYTRAMNEGAIAMKKNRCEGALLHFEDALKVAKKLKEEGLVKVATQHVEEAKKKIEVTPMIEDLMEEVEENMEEKNYKAAIEKMDEIASLSQEIDSKMEVMNEEQYKVLLECGKHLYGAAWLLETNESSDNSEEAEQKFFKTKEILQRTVDLHCTNMTKAVDFLNFTNMKILMNQLFNAAYDLEIKAYKIVEKAKKHEDFSAGKLIYEEALKMYEEAIKIIEASGNERFAANGQVVIEQILFVRKILAKIRLMENVMQLVIGVKFKQIGADRNKMLEMSNAEFDYFLESIKCKEEMGFHV